MKKRKLNRRKINKIKRMLEERKLFIPDDRDFEFSASLASFDDVFPIFEELKDLKCDKVLDCGCSYGAMAKILGDYFHAVPYGIDKDENRLKIARTRLENVFNLDLEKTPLPFKNEEFGLVVSFGTLEHMTYFDRSLKEINRVLKKGGIFIVSLPNLSSWPNIISLLLGYQISDIEVSKESRFGLLPIYAKIPIGHVHTITLKAMKQMLEYYNFEITKITSHKPAHHNGFFFNTIEFLVPFYMKRRPLFCCKKK